jgi:hypothetical protein
MVALACSAVTYSAVLATERMNVWLQVTTLDLT